MQSVWIRLVISQAAATSALTHTCKEMTMMNDEYKKRHDYVVSELNSIEGVAKGLDKLMEHFYVFHKGYLFCFKKYIEMSDQFTNDSELALFILENSKVAVVPGSAFGMDGHIRVSIAIDLNSLKEAMRRLQTTLKL